MLDRRRDAMKKKILGLLGAMTLVAGIANACGPENQQILCGVECGPAYCTWHIGIDPRQACLSGDLSTACTDLGFHCQCDTTGGAGF